MNYSKYLQSEYIVDQPSIILTDSMDRAKALILERGRLVAKKASGGVNLFYSEAPKSNSFWWQKMFGEAVAQEEDETPISGGGTAKVTDSDQNGNPAESSNLSWITKFPSRWNTATSTADSTQGESAPAPSKAQAASYLQVMSYLMTKGGFSKTAAAGIAGVFMAESGLRPGIYNESERKRFGNRGGRGLGQWTDVGNKPGSGWRRTAYENFLNGRTPTLELDLDFFLEEIKSRPKVLEVLNNPNSTLEDIVDAMHRGYENGTSNAFASLEQMGYTYSNAWLKDPAITRKYDFNESAQKRLRFAQQAYNSYNLA